MSGKVGDPCFCCDRPLRELTCWYCGNTFLRHTSGGPIPRYCNDVCRRRYYKAIRLAKENADK